MSIFWILVFSLNNGVIELFLFCLSAYKVARVWLSDFRAPSFIETALCAIGLPFSGASILFHSMFGMANENEDHEHGERGTVNCRAVRKEGSASEVIVSCFHSKKRLTVLEMHLSKGDRFQSEILLDDDFQRIYGRIHGIRKNWTAPEVLTGCSLVVRFHSSAFDVPATFSECLIRTAHQNGSSVGLFIKESSGKRKIVKKSYTSTFWQNNFLPLK